METAATALATARALLDPTGQGLFTDAALLPYLNVAYRAIRDEVTAIREWSANEAVTMLYAVPPQTGSLSAYQVQGGELADLEQPIAIRERPAGTTPESFQEVRQVAELPSRSPDLLLHEYEWRGDGIYFVGASQALDLEIRYVRVWPTIQSAADCLAVGALANTLGWWTAALMAFALREEAQAQQYLAAARHLLYQRVNDFVKTSQITLRRPRPYRSGPGGRSGLGDWL